jgi:O-antigen ligase
MRKIIHLNLTLYFLLVPTAIAAVLIDIVPISFNGRLSGGGILIVLISLHLLLLFWKGNWKYTDLDLLLVALIFFKLIAFLKFNQNFDHISGSAYSAQRNIFLSTIFTYLSFFTLSYFISLKKTQIYNLVKAYSIGAITTIIGTFILIYFIQGNTGANNLFEIKNFIGHYKAGIADPSISLEYKYGLPETIPLLQKWISGIESTLTLGPFLGFLGVFFLGLSVYSKKKFNLYWLILSMFSFCGAFLTGSRSALVSISLSIFTIFFFYNFIVCLRKKDFILRIGLLVIFITTGFAILIFTTDYAQRFSFGILQEQPRLLLWINSILLIGHNPLGYGQGYIFFQKTTGNSGFPFGLQFSHNHSHSAFIQSGIEMGLLGAIVVTGILLVGIYYAFQNVKISRYFHYKYPQKNLYQLIALNLGIVGALTSAIISMLFESKFFISNSIFTPNIIIMLVMAIKINKCLLLEKNATE